MTYLGHHRGHDEGSEMGAVLLSKFCSLEDSKNSSSSFFKKSKVYSVTYSLHKKQKRKSHATNISERLKSCGRSVADSANLLLIAI